jgi:hypothetical protein
MVMEATSGEFLGGVDDRRDRIFLKTLNMSNDVSYPKAN